MKEKNWSQGWWGYVCRWTISATSHFASQIVPGCCPKGPEVSNEYENRILSLCNGSGYPQSLLDWGAESTLSPVLLLIADYKTFFDLSFPRHYIDIVQILFLPQAVPFWENLGNNQQVHRQCSYLTLTRCSKVYAFMIPMIIPSGSGLGVCNKLIILRKTWRIIITQFLNLYCFSKCYFCEISQGCESTLLGIPTTLGDQYMQTWELKLARIKFF